MPLLPKRPLWRRLTILGFIAGALVLAVAAWALYAQFSFGSRIAELRAAGAPVSIADLAPEPIPDEQNAAAAIASIGSEIDAFSAEYAAFHKTPLAKDMQSDRPVSSEQAAAIEAILKKHPQIDAAVAQAAARPRYASQLDFSVTHGQVIQQLLESTQDLRTVARYVNWQMGVAIAEELPAEAVQSGIELLRLAEHYESEAGTISYLVAAAIRGLAIQGIYDALAAGPIPPALHAELDQELARQDNLQGFVDVLKTERAINVSGLQSTPAVPGGMNRVLSYAFSLVNGRHIGGILDYYEQLLLIADEPWHVAHKQPTTSDLLRGRTSYGTIANLTAGSLRAVYHVANRNLVLIRSLRVFNALRQFAEEHGREAKGLEELDLPREATIDPFTGNPLVVKHTEDGWLIYSVMQNGIDDGGDFTKAKDSGVGPPNVRQ